MLKTVQILALLTLPLLASACRTPERVGEVVMDEGALPVSFEIIGAGATARMAAPFAGRVTEPGAWDTLRVRLAFTRPPARVDLAGAMLVVVVPQVASSGHSVHVESIEDTGDTLHVAYAVFSPAADCITEGVPQMPFQVVRLRRVDLPLRFAAREEALRCTFDW